MSEQVSSQGDSARATSGRSRPADAFRFDFLDPISDADHGVARRGGIDDASQHRPPHRPPHRAGGSCCRNARDGSARRIMGRARDLDRRITDITAVSALVVLYGRQQGCLSSCTPLARSRPGSFCPPERGLRALVLSTIGIMTMDVMTHTHTFGKTTFFPGGLAAVAGAMDIIGGAGTAFSVYNERELKRRNAELAMIRRVTLDIEDSLTLSTRSSRTSATAWSRDSGSTGRPSFCGTAR